MTGIKKYCIGLKPNLGRFSKLGMSGRRDPAGPRLLNNCYDLFRLYCIHVFIVNWKVTRQHVQYYFYYTPGLHQGAAVGKEDPGLGARTEDGR